MRPTDVPRPTTALAIVALLSACALRPPPPAPHAPPATSAAVPNPPATGPDNLGRLARLNAERRAEKSIGDYVLGEGDLLSVRAVNLDELTQRVRVAGDGTIGLPLVGSVAVGGKTVAEAQAELRRRVGEFVYDPNVSLFVEEYRSRQVGVMGAVQRPGLVSLTAGHTSVLDALSAAGGMTPDAGGRIYLIPAGSRPGAAPSATAVAPCTAVGAPCPTTVASASETMNDAEPPIMLDVREVGQTAQADLFALPVRPGDVIMVPAGGEFMVQGWVNKPGSYPVKSSLTLQGAIATGGGFTFAANSHRVRLHRLTGNGKTETQDVDYEAIVAKKAPDIFVHDGDVVEVPYSGPRLAAYAVYKTVIDVVHVGIGAGLKVAP
jgi:polysaccharide export outer membrane protein